MWSAIAYVANWRFLFSGTSYASLFSDPSPLQHFWSLAIEEQFYLVFPPFVLFVMAVGGRRLLTATTTIATLGSIAVLIAARDDFDRIYYGTDTRAAELLLGVLLAIWWSGRQRTHDMTSDRRGRLADIAGLLAIAGVLVSWSRVPETWEWLGRGGLPTYAIGTTFIIYVATRPGWTASVLSMRWLRWAGLISYGLYLYHWPIFLWLSEDRTGLPLAPLFVLRMAVTTAIAVLSYRFVEMPIRRATILRSWRSAIPAGIGAASVVAILAVAVTATPPTSTIPYANFRVGDDYTYVEEVQPTVDPSADTAGTVYIVGDSAAMDTQPALGAAFVSSGSSEIIYGAGPGFAIGGTIPWRTMWADIVAQRDPDLVVTMFGPWDLEYISKNGITAYEALMDEALDVVTTGGARVVWLPVLPGGRNDVTALNAAIVRMGVRHPGVVFVPEIDSVFAAPDGSFPRTLVLDDGTELLLRKTDRWHLCQAGAERLANHIVDQLVSIGWSSPVTSGWEDGPWRDSPAYDDPVGVCDVPD